MKVLSGIYKGRNILGFDINGTRPTMDRVKESLFAMIQDYIKDKVVLDLFSGSGNLGIEAVSEGAKYAYLVDYNKKAYDTIKKNINTLGINNASVINKDYQKALNHFYENNIKFDVIFLDPPYKTNYIEESIKKISLYNLLNQGGIIICENDNLDRITYNEDYTEIKQRKYGDKIVVILKKS